MNNFIIFDRDGTLIDLKPYLANASDLNIQNYTVNGLRLLSEYGYRFGVISNQSVIGRGLATVEQVDLVNNHLMKQFNSYGIFFDFVYYCPHSPLDICGCRKPKIALGLNAINNHRINVKKSYMIGDMETDIQFGNSLKLTTVKIGINKSDIANFTAQNIFDAAKWIVAQQ